MDSSPFFCASDHFKTSYNVLQAITQTEITYTKAGKPKGISGSLNELKGFGHKFLKVNKELLEKPFLNGKFKDNKTL